MLLNVIVLLFEFASLLFLIILLVKCMKDHQNVCTGLSHARRRVRVCMVCQV